MEVGRAPIVLSNLVLRRLPGRASLAVSATDLASRGTRTTIALFGEQSGRVLLREAPQGQAIFDVDPGLYSLAAVRCCGEGFAIPFYHAICLPGLHLVGVRTLQLAFYGVNGKDLPRDAQGRAVPVTATEACRSAFASGRMASGATASKGELLGAILDESGGFVMDATVVLRDQRTSVERPVRMSPTGFRLTATPGQYQIRASAPHTGEIRAVVDLREGEQTWWFPRMGPRTGP